MTPHGGVVGELLDQVQQPECQRCERCGCGLIGGAAELMLCSTCLPAEVIDLRHRLAQQDSIGKRIRDVLSERHKAKKVVSL